MEASRFQRDDYDHGFTDLEGLKDTLDLAQEDRTSLVERMTEQVSDSGALHQLGSHGR